MSIFTEPGRAASQVEHDLDSRPAQVPFTGRREQALSGSCVLLLMRLGAARYRRSRVVTDPNSAKAEASRKGDDMGATWCIRNLLAISMG